MPEDLLGGPARRTLAETADGPLKDRLLGSLNLLDNSTRGRLAEVIVAELLGAELTGEAYGSWDLRLGETRIEVKASGEIQSWPQRRPSRAVYSIARSTSWLELARAGRRNLRRRSREAPP